MSRTFQPPLGSLSYPCLPARVSVEQLGCSPEARGRRWTRWWMPATRHEFSKRLSHFVRLNLAQGAKCLPCRLFPVVLGLSLSVLVSDRQGLRGKKGPGSAVILEERTREQDRGRGKKRGRTQRVRRWLILFLGLPLAGALLVLAC